MITALLVFTAINVLNVANTQANYKHPMILAVGELGLFVAVMWLIGLR